MDKNSRILIVGGSGFLSGTLARRAISQNHQVWTVTRGQRPLPKGVTGLTTNRKNRRLFERVLKGANTKFDLVIDCIGYDPEDARTDIAVFRSLTSHVIFVSTDFVYDPAFRVFPQSEEAKRYTTEGYGGKKRLCEIEFLNNKTEDLAWTIVRPCHIYGPGSLLGCIPLHSRDPHLLSKIKNGETLHLVGGGHFLQQPILARDLSDLILSLEGNTNAYSETFCATGPDTVESREYYRIIAKLIGAPDPNIEEIPITHHLSANPDSKPFLCHRIYNISKLKSCGAKVPKTSLYDGLQEHIKSLLAEESKTR